MNRELLLVDDDEMDADLFRVAAEEAGLPLSVTIAHSGEEALALIASGRSSPTAVVLDIKMPGISGLETLRRLKEDPSMRRVYSAVLTSSDLPSDKAEALALGCDLYLTKPGSYTGYLEMVERLKAALPR